MKKITLLKSELTDIISILDKFPEVTNIELTYDTHCGIGHTLSMSFPYVVNDIATTQSIEITGVDSW